jgi:Mn2+/Fe2+ NRAMP family transporter
MAGKSNPTGDEIFVEAVPLSPQDKRLDKLFDQMEQGSLKTLEEAARLVITLCTTLLGAFFGVLAFSDAPAYLLFADVKVLGMLAAAAFFVALLFALLAVSPRRYDFPRASLTGKRMILDDMLQRKHHAVTWASWIFGIGALLMLAAALDILLRI